MLPRMRQSGWLPFQVAILAVIVGLLVVTSFFLIGYADYSGQRSVDVLKREYFGQVANAAAREVLHLSERAARSLRAQRYRIEAGAYAMGDSLALARVLAGILQPSSDFQWASYAEEATGRFVGATRVGPDRLVLNVSAPNENRGVPREVYADSLEPYRRTPPLTEPYEPRTHEWYRHAAAAAPGTIVWMPPYTFAEGVKGVTAAIAAWDGSQRLLGVATLDLSLAGIEAYLGTIKLPAQGTVILFDRNGEPFAGAGGAGREAASRAVGAWARDGRGGIARDVRLGVVRVGGDDWAVGARSVTEEHGLAAIVGIAIPEHVFTDPVRARRRTSIIIALGAAAVAVLAGVLLSIRIARPLRAATGGLDRIARFELAPPGEDRSMLREIAKLQDAVSRVVASLVSFTRFAPEEVVREVIVSGQPAMLSGNRREVTTLFADLRGFTAFAERIPPEEVVAILNDHFDTLVALVARHGGFVVDFLGDSVFAVFGAPGHLTAHAERAVACAIDMQRARAGRNTENRQRGWPPLEMGVGIDTGSAVVGNMGAERRIKYGVVGHVVNSAARIETLTVGGQVLVSDATRRALADRLIVDGPFEVGGKGIEDTMRIWAALALRGETLRVLPDSVSDLETLPRPIDAHVRLIFGKQIDPHRHPARIHRLGAAGAEVESRAPLAVFGPLQLLLPPDPGESQPGPIDGKVIGISDENGRHTALMRFTGIGWDIREWIDAYARRARDRVTAGTGS